jgi:hypothetical protein
MSSGTGKRKRDNLEAASVDISHLKMMHRHLTKLREEFGEFEEIQDSVNPIMDLVNELEEKLNSARVLVRHSIKYCI